MKYTKCQNAEVGLNADKLHALYATSQIGVEKQFYNGCIRLSHHFKANKYYLFSWQIQKLVFSLHIE